MAEKISTLVLKVDLECYKCYKKIKKVLCRLQDPMKIRTISYDEKNNTVTLCGPFDPEQLSRKLRCKACKVILDIKVVEKHPCKEEKKPDPPPPPPPKKEKKPDPPPPPPPPKEEKKPDPPPPPPPKEEKKPDPPPPPPPKEEKKSDPPPPPPPKVEKKPDPPPPTPKPVPVCQSGPVCCCRPCPCYHGSYGGHRCCSCGVVYVFGDGPPMGYGKPCYDSFTTYFCEEQPSSCVIM